MSPISGKRVLTASTTLALAAVGLAGIPAHAAAVLTPTLVNGCGTADILKLPDKTYTQYSPDGGTTMRPLTYAPDDADTSAVIDLSTLPDIYATTTGGGETAGLLKSTFRIYKGNVEQAAITAGASTLTNTKCSITADSTTAANPDPSNPSPVFTGKVKEPTITNAAPPATSGGTLHLFYTEGVNWEVTDGGGTRTFTKSAFSATTAGTQLDVTTTGTTVTVKAVPVSANFMLSPSNMLWSFVTNGTTLIPAPVSPVVASDISKIEFNQSGVDFAWHVTDATVTSVDVAKATNNLGDTTTQYSLTSSDRGTTKRFWAIATAGKSFSPDGVTYKIFDVVVPQLNMITLDPLKTTWVDQTGTASDTVTVPAVPGVNYFYTWKSQIPSAGVQPDSTLGGYNVGPNSGQWHVLGAGSPVQVTTPVAAGDQLVIAVALADPKTGKFAKVTSLYTDKGITSAMSADSMGPVYFGSPSNYTALQIVTPAIPTYNDGSGLDDSITFPTATPGVSYGVSGVTASVNGAGAVDITAKINDNNLWGQTVKRTDWVSKLNLPSSDGGDVKFVFTPTPAAGWALPASYSNLVEPWTKTVTAGTLIAAPAPVFTDNNGTGVQDEIKVSQTLGVDYKYDTSTDGGKTYTGSPIAFTYTNGVSTVKVAAGVTVKVIATAQAGYAFSNADADSANKSTATFINGFTDGTVVTPAAPTQVNLPGTDKDTYTIVGSSGVDYYVDGVKFDPAKFNLPQSTAGKATLTITAKAMSGYTIAAGAKTEWKLDYASAVIDKPVISTAWVDNATRPTAVVSWTAKDAKAYTVTFQKINEDGTLGPVVNWMTNTTDTTAKFFAGLGSKWRISAVAIDDKGGMSDAATYDLTFPNQWSKMTDLTSQGVTFTGSWKDLRNLNLPYFGKSALIGFSGTATMTVPANTKTFDLYAAVFAKGGSGTIQVNGRNWADFTTKGADPTKFQQMVRHLNLPATGAPVTIKIITRNAPGQYLALDSYILG
ncbi:hypothetical protein KEM60_01297 [Austwickia sp. TVS 96-490-7B]|uniref:hypothetical protein n=1 Tax=Austwickia sp. TVS 96-490-7B TaxID=2830843 RepID=UPI001C58E6DC|nr:hypothetical protein [Austwickia sp. TVS 96-490-7B]MBW3085104.1 hypothetical protein [Austwickia sp. TVS 96-490-7B]